MMANRRDNYVPAGNVEHVLLDPRMQPRVLLERIHPPNPLSLYYRRQEGDGQARLQVQVVVPEVLVPHMGDDQRREHERLLQISCHRDLPTLVCVCKLNHVITPEVLLLNVNRAFSKFSVPLLCYRLQPADTAKASLSHRSAYFLYCIRAYPNRGATLPVTQCKAVNHLRAIVKGVLEGSSLLPGHETLSVTHEVDLEGCHLSAEELAAGPGVRRIPTQEGFVYSTVGCARSYFIVVAMNSCAVCQRGVEAPILQIVGEPNQQHNYVPAGNVEHVLLDPRMQPRVLLERIHPPNPLSLYYRRQEGDGQARLQVQVVVPEVLVPHMGDDQRREHERLLQISCHRDLPTLVCVCKLNHVITPEVLLLNVNRAFSKFSVPLLCYRLQPADTAKASLSHRSAYFLYCIRAYPNRGATLPVTQCKAVNHLRAIVKGVLEGSSLLPGHETLSVTHEVDLEGCHLSAEELAAGPGVRRIPTQEGFVYSTVGCSRSYFIIAAMNTCNVCQRGVEAPLLPV